MESDKPSDAVLDALWGRVLEKWDEQGAHDALLEYALAKQCLPDLAGRYKALKDDPQKGAFAKRRLDAIVIAATQLLLSAKTPAMKKIPREITLSAVLVFLFLMGLLFYAFLRRS